jgi:chromate transporter
MEAEADTERSSLAEVAWVFLRLGLLSFGGPAAHVALMEDELVRRRRWLTRERFLDLYGAVNLMPGPNSTKLAIQLGRARAGWRGLVVAGVCFILPAALMVWGLAVAYVEYGSLPQARGALYGLGPVLIVIIGQALLGLAPRAAKTRPLALLAVAAASANALGVNELLVLAAAGVAAVLLRATTAPTPLAAVLPLPLAVAAPATLPASTLFLTFLKIGSVLFGSGYVLFAFLEADLGPPDGPLTRQQLLDSVAAGQVTPGPLFSTATFVGYILGGHLGAAAATVGIFLPAFVFVAVSGPLIPRLRASPTAGAFLDGVNAASLALMAVVTYRLADKALVDDRTWAVAVAAAFVLWRWRINTLWLVPLGLAVGLASATWR